MPEVIGTELSFEAIDCTTWGCGHDAGVEHNDIEFVALLEKFGCGGSDGREGIEGQFNNMDWSLMVVAEERILVKDFLSFFDFADAHEDGCSSNMESANCFDADT